MVIWSTAKVTPLPDRVRDLQAFPPPSSKLGLQRFLGMLNYYRRFILSLADKIFPLHKAVALAKKPKDFIWTKDCGSAFTLAKSSLAAATVLHHLVPFAGTAIMVNASDHAVGAELAQRSQDGGPWRPLAFFAKSLLVEEKRYSVFDGELLAIFLTIKHF